jgi:hypothetical protein
MDNNKLIKEWEVTYKGAMHFNDLLMRLRTLGLPAIITITGGATVYTISAKPWTMSTLLIGIIMILLSAFLTWLVRWMFHRPYIGKPPKDGDIVKDILLQSHEKIMWKIIIVITYLYTTLFFAYNYFQLLKYKNVPLGSFLIVFGLIIIIAFYVLDRFYYYNLLIGAVVRLEEIEEKIGYKTTRTVSIMTPRYRSAVVITTLYFLPGAIGYILLLTVFLFM